MADYINLNELSITTQALLKKINEQADLKVDKDEVVQNTQSGDVIATVGDVDIYNGVDLVSLYDSIPQYTSDLTNDSGFITIDHSHGHITSAGAITDTGVALTSGDSLVFSDASDSGKLRKTSITFDGTNTKQFLSKKGTFENVTALEASSASNLTEYELLGVSQGGQDPKTVINCGMATIAKYTSNYARLTLGTSTTDGVLRLYNNGTTDLRATSAAGSRTVYLPTSEGTLALTSDIPIKVSDLTNDSGYQTQSEVNTLIGTAIGNINQFNVAVVQSLPTQDIDAHTIYFLPNSGAGTNVYDEYMYINNNWECIGSTSIDLSGYVPTSRTVNGKALSSDISLDYQDVGALSSSTAIPDSTSDLTNDSGFITGADIPVTDVQTEDEVSVVSNGIATIPTEVFWVTFTQENGVYTADKTFDETYQASLDGKIVCAIDGSLISYLVASGSTLLTFARATSASIIQYAWLKTTGAITKTTKTYLTSANAVTSFNGSVGAVTFDVQDSSGNSLVSNGVATIPDSSAYILTYGGTVTYSEVVAAYNANRPIYVKYTDPEEGDLLYYPVIDLYSSGNYQQIDCVKDAGIINAGGQQTVRQSYMYWNTTTGWYIDNSSVQIPTVPTNVSSFTNDAGYLTLSTLPIYDGTVI